MSFLCWVPLCYNEARLCSSTSCIVVETADDFRSDVKVYSLIQRMCELLCFMLSSIQHFCKCIFRMWPLEDHCCCANNALRPKAHAG